MICSKVIMNRQKSGGVKFHNLEPGSFFSHTDCGAIYMKLDKSVIFDGKFRESVSLATGALYSTEKYSDVICLDVNIQIYPHMENLC